MGIASVLSRLLVLPLVPLALATSATRRPATVPLTLSDSLTYTAPGTLGGRPAPLTIDTGAGVCRVPPSLVPGAAPAGTAPGASRPGEPALFDLVRVPALAVGAARWDGAVVASWPLLDEMHAGGVVSARLFADTPFTLDLGARRLVFENAASLRARAARGVVVPLVVHRSGDAWLLPLARTTVDGAPRLLVVDTGLPSALELAAAAGPHTVSLGEGLTRERVEAYRRPVPDADGRLGLAFFEGRALTFDLPGSRLIVSR